MDERELIICRCEEVSEGEIVDAIEWGARTVTDVKRLTRAGKGLCQGKTCGRLVSQLLQKSGKGLEKPFPKPSTVRPPVRPLKVGELASEENEDR
jgi:NAD(P)H-nitrite reductase large subunit